MISRSKLRIGVVDATTAGTLRQELLGSGIPSNALKIEVQPPVVPRLQLSDRSRPVKAGFEICGSHMEYCGCTLGFNAYWQGMSRRVFVTAAHCSEVKFETDSGRMAQPSKAYGNWIGTEVYDREMYNCDEFEGGHDPCRVSDAAIYEYDDTVAFDNGYITRTMYPGFGQPGSTTVDPAKPKFTITDKTGPDELAVGDYVNKVGYVTGWTRGKIRATCVYIWEGENLYDMYDVVCQDVAELYLKGGDSGSPVFVAGGLGQEFQESIGWYAELTGILWGSPLGVDHISYFSHIYNIEHDLGELLVDRTPH